MGKSVLISVVVTNHNYAPFLARCIRSLVEQTLPASEYEIILVDDASTDNSLEIYNIFQDRVRVKALKENVGLASAANHGLRIARGRYCVRVDSDDYVHPDFLKCLTLFMTLKSEEFDAVSVDYVKIDKAGKHLESVNAANHPIACGIAFKFEAMNEIGLYKNGLRINEDLELRKRFDESGLRMGHLPLPLYRYTQHGNSLTNKQLSRLTT